MVRAACFPFLLLALVLPTGAADAPIDVRLTMQRNILGAGPSQVPAGYLPTRLPLSSERPPGITKEPSYRGKPAYATMRLGDGPRALYHIAIDRPADGDWRIYLDLNKDGDLTLNGNGAWAGSRQDATRKMYGINHYDLLASWGFGPVEVDSAVYGINLYLFSDRDFLLAFRSAAAVGQLSIEGKTHRIMVIENDNDALFNKTVATDPRGIPLAEPTSRPVWLMIDWDDNNTFRRTGERNLTEIDLRFPFRLGNENYEASLSSNGALLTLTPTARPPWNSGPRAISALGRFRFGICDPATAGQAARIATETLSLPQRLKSTGFRWGFEYTPVGQAPYNLKVGVRAPSSRGSAGTADPVKFDYGQKTGPSTTSFSFDDGDSLGDWTVEIFIDDEMAQSFTFRVVADK